MRGAVGRRELGVAGQPLGHLAHQPGASRRADGRGGPRAGQVVQRRERRAVRQPRRRSRRRRVAAAGSGARPRARRAASRPSCAATAARSRRPAATLGCAVGRPRLGVPPGASVGPRLAAVGGPRSPSPPRPGPSWLPGRSGLDCPAGAAGASSARARRSRLAGQHVVQPVARPAPGRTPGPPSALALLLAARPPAPAVAAAARRAARRSRPRWPRHRAARYGQRERPSSTSTSAEHDRAPREHRSRCLDADRGRGTGAPRAARA